MPRLTQLTRLVLVMFSLGAAAFCSAQATKDGVTHIDSRVDIYGGYGYFHPINSGINGFQYQPVYNPNATVSVSAFFNHYFGVQIEGGYFSGTTEHKQYVPTCTGETCSQLIYTAEAGPVFRLPLGPFVPFAHLLGGGERTNGPAAQSLMWGWGVTGGVGVDYVLPLFNYRFAIRPIQADYQYSQVVYGPLLLPAGKQGGFGTSTVFDRLCTQVILTRRFLKCRRTLQKELLVTLFPSQDLEVPLLYQSYQVLTINLRSRVSRL